MKKCKICNTENNEQNEICSYCGCYLGFTKFHKWLIIGLFLWPALFYAIYLAIKDKLKMDEIRKNNNVNIKELLFKHNTEEKGSEELKPLFVKASSFRKKDGIIKAGECLLEFNEDTFLIKQDDQIVENKISSIYLLDIWEYKDDTYFKIVMRSHTEYMFVSMHFEADSVLEILSKLDVIIEDNRKEE